jgi:hypothetical protein
MEAYRNKFEEAMIRIEDEEDIEAYREAKAEIDDEFKEELLEAQVIAGTALATSEPKEDEAMAETEMIVEHNQKQFTTHLDTVSKDLKRSEMIEWRDHPKLNQVTKMAI